MRTFALAVVLAVTVAACSSEVVRSPARATPAPPTIGATPGPSTAGRPTASPTERPTSAPPAPTAVPTEPPDTTPPPATPAPPPTPAPPTLAELIGQKLVVAMDGPTPSATLLARIRHGEIGGVILFARNITTPSALEALTATLRRAAAAGGQPPLLIATDQEGGSVKRIPWAPPTLSPPQMGDLDSAATAHHQGALTGAALVGLGIDGDFAPVADVPGSTGSFMYEEDRTWSFDPVVTATLSDAFARGLAARGVVPVLKHFPGLGLATSNTDTTVVTLTASAQELAPGLQPYRVAIADRVPMIMLSNATYTAFDPTAAAGWSRAIGHRLLRHDLGFRGVTITDSLSGTAKARGVEVSALAILAAGAGTDMILVTGSEAGSERVYEALVAAATTGAISRARLQASYDRILALKSGL